MQAKMRRVAIPRHISREAAQPSRGEVRALSGATMGTTWSVRYVSTEDRDAALLDVIEVTLAMVVSQMSTWDPRSDICRFNQTPVGEWFDLKPEMMEVVSCGRQIQLMTAGAFDLSLGRPIESWGFGAAGAVSQIPNAIAQRAGGDSIELDSMRKRVRRVEDIWIELSGIAKGYAVDAVLLRLRASGVTNCLVEIGGELAGEGVKPDGTPWWVGIHGLDGTAPVAVGLHGLGLATSGVERRIKIAERYYSHTINPTTSHPIDNGVVQSTVIADRCMVADAQATALIVMGATEGIRWSNAHNVAAVIWEMIDGLPREHVSRAMSELFGDI